MIEIVVPSYVDPHIVSYSFMIIVVVEGESSIAPTVKSSRVRFVAPCCELDGAVVL